MTALDRYWLQLFMLNGLMIVALHLAPFRRVVALAARLADATRTTRQMPRERLIELLRMQIRYIRRHSFVSGKCLSRSIALYAVLRRYGIDAEIHIGVRSESSEIVAHAWVEVDGRPVNAGPAVRDRYRTFDHAFTPLP